MAFGVHDAQKLIERGRRLVDALEAGDGRDAFVTAGYGEGDHAQGQRVVRTAEEALAEAQRSPSISLRLQQFSRAIAGWLETRAEDLKREGLNAVKPSALARHAMDLAARVRPVARGAVAHENLETSCQALKKWLDRWTPVARRVAKNQPELGVRFGVSASPLVVAPDATKASG